MEDTNWKRNLESAGGWFVGEYASLIISKFRQLENDKEIKKEFIQNIFHSQGRDKDYGGTRTRVNAVLRIIKSDQIEEALEYIVCSERMKKEEPRAVQNAKETLMQIKSS
ncbi:hypothetical protein AB1L07_20975 [Niallia alba]|uniref:hypothetical protein n=1 Tax=Niallia alba TaxID=2729105 RepID=UPI0039A22FCD